MDSLILTNEWANQIEQADLDVMADRLIAMQEKDGNRAGVELKRFGGATALLTRGIPISDFNKVYGFSPDDLDELDAINDFYQSQVGKIPYGIDVIPSRTSPEMFRRLTEKGFQQTGFHTAFICGVDEIVWMPASGVDIRQVEASDLGTMEKTFIESLEIPYQDTSELLENFAGLLERPGWKIFLGFVDDKPAGFGMLLQKGEVATLALAGTKPQFRGKGLQMALLMERLRESRSAGCKYVIAQASFGGVSMRNLQRCGFRVAYTKATWTYRVN